MPRSAPGSRISLPTHPGPYLVIGALAHAALSYGALPTAGKVLVAGLAIGLPLLGAFRSSARPEGPSETKEFFPSVPTWTWALLGLGVLAVHFYRLTTLSAWPTYDEGMYGHYAAELARGGDGRFFYGPSQAPPLYLWLLAAGFNLFGVSLASLWSLPALLSALLFPAAYWAARGVFSRSFALVLALLGGFSFWPFYVGRFSLMTGLVLLVEVLALGFLARALTATSSKRRHRDLATLGAVTGLGFYTYLHWPVLALLILLIILAKVLGPWRREAGVLLLYFLVPTGLVMLPLLIALRHEGAEQLSSYLGHLSAAQAPSFLEQVRIAFSYVASLFWGMDLSFHTYQPVWGGYLNPVLNACFFWGLGEVLRRRNAWTVWVLTALVLFILPGALTSERATSRMVLVFPVLAGLTALGIARLAQARSQGKAWVLGLALFSLGLDLFHLGVAYPRVWDSLDHWKGYGKSYARYQAYLQWENLTRTSGPGLLLSDFLPGLTDETLSVAAHDLDALQAPLALEKIRWAGLLTNVHYQPFLKRRFPEAKAYPVSKGLADSDGGFMLFVIPVTPSCQADLERWARASRALDPFIERSLNDVAGRSLDGMIRALDEAYPSFQGDPFLESVYWEKRADLSLRQTVLARGSRPEALQGAIQALEQALKKGYPAAHLYRDLGADLAMAGRTAMARTALHQATRAPLDLTDAGTLLKSLEAPPLSTKVAP